MNRAANTPLLLDFLRGRDAAGPLPPYWTSGRSALALYLEFFMGPETDPVLWRDGGGAVVACARVCPPDDSRPAWLAFPNSWQLLVHPPDRNDHLLDTVVQQAEAALGGGTGPPIATQAFEGDKALTGRLENRGYRRDVYLSPYMTR